MALASSYFDRALPEGTASFGEIGLGGEVRKGLFVEERLKECKKLGMTRVILPYEKGRKPSVRGLEIIQVRSVKEALAILK